MLSGLSKISLWALPWSKTLFLRLLILLLVRSLSVERVICIKLILRISARSLVQIWLRLKLLLITIVCQNISAISSTSHLSSSCNLTHACRISTICISIKLIIIIFFNWISQLILVSHLIIGNWICVVRIVPIHFWFMN